MRTLTPTRPRLLSHSHTGRLGESNPRHDVHSIGCCHYTRSADFKLFSFGQRKRRDSNPHRPTGRPRLANACDETDIRLSSRHSHAPARNRTWISSFARSRGHPFHHGDASSFAHISPPGL